MFARSRLNLTESSWSRSKLSLSEAGLFGKAVGAVGQVGKALLRGVSTGSGVPAPAAQAPASRPLRTAAPQPQPQTQSAPQPQQPQQPTQAPSTFEKRQALGWRGWFGAGAKEKAHLDALLASEREAELAAQQRKAGLAQSKLERQKAISAGYADDAHLQQLVQTKKMAALERAKLRGTLGGKKLGARIGDIEHGQAQQAQDIAKRKGALERQMGDFERRKLMTQTRADLLKTAAQEIPFADKVSAQVGQAGVKYGKEPIMVPEEPTRKPKKKKTSPAPAPAAPSAPSGPGVVAGTVT